MHSLADILLVLVLLSNLYLLGASRLGAAIKAIAFQGVLLAILPLIFTREAVNLHAWILSAGSFTIKGVIMPILLFRAIREVKIQREVEPFIPLTASLLLGMLIVLITFWLGWHFNLPTAVSSILCVPTALAGVMMGLLLLVSRKKALMQVIGYMVLENGIYVFAMPLVVHMPFLVEIGVLLDVFVGVFIMGIIMNHIKNIFDSLSIENLMELKK